MNKFKRYLTRLVRILKKPEVGILPGQVAFFLVLSMIPLLTLIAVIASQFSISIDSLINALSDTLPAEIISILVPALQSPSFGIGVSMIIGFIVASNGTCSLISASNMLFKIDSGTYLRKRVKGLLMLIELIILFLFILIVMTFGNTIFSFIYSLFFAKQVSTWAYFIFLIVKWLLSIFVIFFMIKLVFTMAPDASIPSKKMNRGAIFTTIMWVIATSIYSTFVNDFANYNIFYSSLANIVVLMIWIYILSYALVIGIAINSEDYLEEKN